jgi:hypothetical protein
MSGGDTSHGIKTLKEMAKYGFKLIILIGILPMI